MGIEREIDIKKAIEREREREKGVSWERERRINAYKLVAGGGKGRNEKL